MTVKKFTDLTIATPTLVTMCGVRSSKFLEFPISIVYLNIILTIILHLASNHVWSWGQGFKPSLWHIGTQVKH